MADANQHDQQHPGSPSPAAPAGFAGPVKHSITIAGHQTSISLEPLFWDALQRAAREEDIPLNSLVARIDMIRIGALTHPRAQDGAPPLPPANLASAIRSWLWERYCGRP